MKRELDREEKRRLIQAVQKFFREQRDDDAGVIAADEVARHGLKLAELPADSPYRQTVGHSVVATIADLWRRAAAYRSDPRSAEHPAVAMTPPQRPRTRAPQFESVEA